MAYVGGMRFEAETTYDEEADAGYLAFSPIAQSAAVSQLVVQASELQDRGDIVIDMDSEGRVLGVEFIGVSTLLARSAFK